MVEVSFSEFRHGDLAQPTCCIEKYEILGDYFTMGLHSTRQPLVQTLAACKKIAAGTLTSFSAGGSEAHVVTVSRPTVVIERTYLTDAAEPYEWQECRVPFDVFFQALTKWREHVRQFEKRMRDSASRG